MHKKVGAMSHRLHPPAKKSCGRPCFTVLPDSETRDQCVRHSDPRHTAEGVMRTIIDKSVGERRRRLQCILDQNGERIEHMFH